jgi:hypothetical protein
MTDKPITPDQRVVFAVAPETGTENIVLVLQVPPGGWEYMKDGTSHTFDLTKVGIGLKVILAGCADRAAGIRVLEEWNAKQGNASLHMPGTDFGIKPKEGA